MYVYDAPLITHRFSHYVHSVCKSVLKLCLELEKRNSITSKWNIWGKMVIRALKNLLRISEIYKKKGI